MERSHELDETNLRSSRIFCCCHSFMDSSIHNYTTLFYTHTYIYINLYILVYIYIIPIQAPCAHSAQSCVVEDFSLAPKDCNRNHVLRACGDGDDCIRRRLLLMEAKVPEDVLLRGCRNSVNLKKNTVIIGKKTRCSKR